MAQQAKNRRRLLVRVTSFVTFMSHQASHQRINWFDVLKKGLRILPPWSPRLYLKRPSRVSIVLKKCGCKLRQHLSKPMWRVSNGCQWDIWWSCYGRLTLICFCIPSSTSNPPESNCQCSHQLETGWIKNIFRVYGQESSRTTVTQIQIIIAVMKCITNTDPSLFIVLNVNVV